MTLTVVSYSCTLPCGEMPTASRKGEIVLKFSDGTEKSFSNLDLATYGSLLAMLEKSPSAYDPDTQILTTTKRTT